jgi:hypothetical protein
MVSERPEKAPMLKRIAILSGGGASGKPGTVHNSASVGVHAGRANLRFGHQKKCSVAGEKFAPGSPGSIFNRLISSLSVIQRSFFTWSKDARNLASAEVQRSLRNSSSKIGIGS